MVFSDTSNKNGIIQLCEKYTGLGKTVISGDSDLLAEFTMYANKASRRIKQWIFSAYGGWIYDDENHSDLPIVTTALEADRTTYPLDTESNVVMLVEFKNSGSDSWQPLNPITLEQIRDAGMAESEFMRSYGVPKYYRLFAGSLKLYPGSNYAQASSLRVHMKRDIHDFVVGDTTAVPGFYSGFHEAVPVGASIEWLIGHKADSPTLTQLQNIFDNPNNPSSYCNQVKDFYAQRLAELFPPNIGNKRNLVNEFR
jgi:hypothetical protein